MYKQLTGCLILKKPRGVTSFTCVRKLQRIINDKSVKIGHSGTLDTFACGILILSISRSATRVVNTSLQTAKGYRITAKLGELTDSLDYTGKLIETQPIYTLTSSLFTQATARLQDHYEQTPPIYSALKHQGLSLYKLARKQKISYQELIRIAQTKRRTVTIHSILLNSIDTPFFSFEAYVSHGTYIRSLVYDIAQLCNNVATTYQLCRHAIGAIALKDAISIDELQTIADVQHHLHPIEKTYKLLTATPSYAAQP